MKCLKEKAYLTLARIACFILLFTSVAAFGAASPAPSKIVSIHVAGQQRYSEAQIVAASGLQPGQDFSEENVQAAVQKLGATGAFDNVEYRYKPEGSGTEVEFNVTESGKLHRFVFDNLVWLSNSEVDEYLRKHVPLFSDLLPESGTVLDEVAAALQQLLANNKIDAQVMHIQYGALGSSNWLHLFSAMGPQLKITSVQFQGAEGVDPTALKQEAGPLIGRGYSSVQCQEFAKDTFVPLYRERGYLRVAIAAPLARVVAQPTGTGTYDIEVSYPVIEGLVYNWGSVKWSGNQVLASSDLEALMNMKHGELANGKRIDSGLVQVGQGYGKKGYIEAKVQLEPAYDDVNRVVSYGAAISEGRQYHMGAFTVTGIVPAVAQQIQSKWRLKAGDIYDSTYLRDFGSKDLSTLLSTAHVQVSSVQTATQLNRDQLTVDVSIILK